MQYGEAGTSDSLTAQNGAWRLGGGGGTLEVNFRLDGSHDLILGANESSTGSVYLANGNNSFSGDVLFNASGIRLGYADGALGNSTVNLTYGNGLVLSRAEDVARVATNAEGLLLLDNLSTETVDLSGYSAVALGASVDTVFSGTIVPAADAAYRFGAMDGAALRIDSALDATRDIVVDAQGTTGGTVILAGNATLSGDILVQGYKDASHAGSISLAIGRDMTASGSISLAEDTYLDAAGYNLTVTQGIVGSGEVIDSESTGSLIFDATAGDISSAISLNLDTVRKTGDNTLHLSGAHAFGALYVDGGTLALTGDFATALSSRIYLANNTTLNVQTDVTTADIAMLANAGTASLLIGTNATASLKGDIRLGNGSQLNMSGTGSTYKLQGGMYGGEGATLSVRAGELHFETNANVDVVGTLSVENNLRIFSNGSATDMERNIGELKINNNATVTLDEATWNTIWNVDKLTGAGELLWNSNTTHDSTSRLVLRGEGDFSGTIALNRRFEKDTRTHGAFIELAHDKAARNASVSLTGASANAVASLAVNTKDAQIKGLTGNEFSYVYAGQSMAAAELSGVNRPPTTRSATLTLNVDSGRTFTYAGTVGQSSDTTANGLSLNKTGAGTQQFTGATHVNNITVQQGSLLLNAETLTVKGNVGVGRGATLSMGDFTLSSGRTFSVLSGMNGATGSAAFAGTLTLAGGELSFSGAAMAAGGTTLSLGGLNTGSVTGQTVHFTDTSSLQAGQTYTLASGDWSSIYGSMTASGLHYYDATFGVNTAGNLQVSLALKSNSLVWNGTGGFATEWSDNNFGDSSATYNSATTVVFDDSAASKYVGTYCTKTISAIVFNTTDSYRVETWSGGSSNVTATDLVVQGGGTVSINGGIRITGTTTIEDGELVLQSSCNANTLKGSVTGAGTLVIDGASNVNPNLVDLHALHIKNGTYGSTSVETLDVDNIIVDAAGRYIHGSTYEGKITSNGGVLEIYKGSLGGELELTADTTIETYSSDVNAAFRLNSLITDNGHSLIHTGGGLVEMTTASRSVLNQYVVRNGKLVFAEGSHSGHGNITVESGSVLRLKGNAKLMTTSVNLTDGSTVEIGAAAALMSDATVTGCATASLGNESSFLKGSVTGDGTLALTGQGVVQSRLADSSAGALVLEVSGTSISLLAANTHSGGTVLNSGSLYARNSQALGTGAVTVNGGTLWLDISGMEALSTVSSVTLNSGSVLDVSAATFTSDSGLLLGGSLSVGSGACINLGNLSTDNVKYTIFDLTADGASVADWLNMQDRIMVNGSLLSSMSDYSLGLTSYGATLTFGTVLPDPLIWQGGETGVWNQTADNWDNTPKIPDDSVVFTNGDSVEFASSAAVQVAEGVVAQNMTIGEGVDLALSGNLAVSGAIIAGGDAFTTSGNLTAEKITITSGSFETGVDTKLTAENVYQKGGSLSIKGAADIGVLNVSAGLTAELYNNSASDGEQKQIDAVHLGNGSVLAVNDRDSSAGATTLGAVQLNGDTATIQDVHHSGHVVIETLNMNSTLDGSTLNLVKKSASDKVTRFEFGAADAAAGNFKGRVELSTDVDGSSRPAAIILSGKNALTGAVVDLHSTSKDGHYLGLGINADGATIAGLESGEAPGTRAKLFSGTISADTKWDANNTPGTISQTERTLYINTAAGASHTFNGEVLAKLNLVKQGEGTQVFNGTSNSFDGSLTVQNGTLELGADALGMLGSAASVTVSGGVLDLSAASFSEGSGLALGGALSVSGGAIKIDNIGTTGTYNIFDLSAAGASATGWEELKDKLIVNGACLNRYEGADLALTDSAAQLSFTSLETTKYTDLVWNGGDKGVWDQASRNWNSETGGDNIMFLNGDGVSFQSSADVTVAQGVSVNDLTLAEGVALKTHGGVTVSGTLNTGTNSSWTLAAGSEQSLTEAQLKSVTSALVVEKGATLTMTNKTTGQDGTTTAFDKVSGAGNIALELGVDNGIGINAANVTGDIIVNTGRLQVNACTFNNASVIRLKTADSQLVFHATGTELSNNVELSAANTGIHVNSNKSGTISGVISGEGGLNKLSPGTLTFAAQNTYKGATTISNGKLVLDTGSEYGLYNTISGGTLEVASKTSLANNGHAVTSALVLNSGATWKVSADASGEYVLNTSVSGDGKVQVLSGTSFKNNGRSLPLALSLDSGSKWVVSGTTDGIYTLNTAVSGAGTVEVAKGSTLLVDGSSNENLILSADVKVNSGAVLAFEDNDGTDRSDMLDYKASSRKLTVAGGTLDFGGSRQTMGTWTLELSDGAVVNGAGGKYNNGANQAAMDYNNASGNTIKATSGTNTINATTRLRYGSELIYDIAKDVSLNVAGLVHADGGGNGGIVKDGAGTLYLNNANNDLDSVVVKGGSAQIQGAAAYTLATLHAAAGSEVGFYTAALARSAGTTTNVTVSDSVTVGGGSKLNMNLGLASGSTLEVLSVNNGPATLNGSLSFAGKVAMGDSLLAEVLALKTGESLSLFTGENLVVTMDNSELSAAYVSSYFNNKELTNLENVYVTYDNVNNIGYMSIASIPEPATVTMSLLALAALATRRRRR